MGLAAVATELGTRATFGSELIINDGRLRIREGQLPERITIIGNCNNTATDPNDATRYLVPTNEPRRIVSPSDLKYFNNSDPDNTPSEILLQYVDAYNAGGRNFEFVICSRTVAQLGGDIDADDLNIPASTVYTGRMTEDISIGGHPLQAVGFKTFEHNGNIFCVGGELPNTPAAGIIDFNNTYAGPVVNGDTIEFTRSGSDPITFEFRTSGSATAGNVAVDVSAAGSDTNVATAFILAGEALDADVFPFALYASGETVLVESEEQGTAGNGWTMTATFANTAPGLTQVTGGSTTNVLTNRLYYFDTTTEVWHTVKLSTGIPTKLPAARRDGVIFPVTGTTYQWVGGMSTLRGAGTDSAEDDVYLFTMTSTSTNTTAITTPGQVSSAYTNIGEMAGVKTAAGIYYLIGGNIASGAATTRTAIVATYVPSTRVATSVGALALDAATRWPGASYFVDTNHIFVFGGDTASGAIATTEALNLTSVSKETAGYAGDMAVAKYDFGYAGLNGAAWVFGGTDGSAEQDGIERFDPDNLVWREKDTLDTAASGGVAIATAGNKLVYIDDNFGTELNIGLGNLTNANVGFPASYPYYIQCEWEVMAVGSVTTVRSRGKDMDAFVVTRAQLGSSAIAHVDYADITMGPATLFTDLDTTYEAMMNMSNGDYILPPVRAVADCPYLAVGSNFAFQLGSYCHLKSKFDRACMGAVGVYPANQNPRILPTLTEDATWVTKLTDYTRTNYAGAYHWRIGNGVDDADGDNKPDTYAFFATTDVEIPVGTPPMEAGNVERDDDNKPTDLGKYLFVIRAYGMANDPMYAKKFPNATLGYMRHGAASYVGATTLLGADEGGTNMPSRGFVPHRFFSLVQENQLVLNRYLGVVNRGNIGTRWDTDYTFAWNVSRTARSDYILGATFRRTVLMSRNVRNAVAKYFGKPVIGPSRNALEADLSEVIKAMVQIGAAGPTTDYQIVAREDDRILGQVEIIVEMESVGELVKARIPISQK